MWTIPPSGGVLWAKMHLYSWVVVRVLLCSFYGILRDACKDIRMFGIVTRVTICPLLPGHILVMISMLPKISRF